MDKILNQVLLEAENPVQNEQQVINAVVVDCMAIKCQKIWLRQLSASCINPNVYDGIDVVAFKDNDLLVIKCDYDNSSKDPEKLETITKTLADAKNYYSNKNPDKRIVMMNMDGFEKYKEQILYVKH